MTRRLARLALMLYPLAFRRRYAEEVRALLDQTPTRAPTVLDLLRGAPAAHLRPPAAAASLVDGTERLRASASGQLACWVAFAAAGFGFYKTTEGGPSRLQAMSIPCSGMHTALSQHCRSWRQPRW